MRGVVGLALVSALAWVSGPVSAGVITEIGLGDFITPKVLDYQTAPLGAISGSASLFTNFGISSVSAVGSDFSDGLGNRPNASRSLWFNESGLQIVDPGAGGLAADQITYTIDFASAIGKFGWAWHDQDDAMLVEFFLGATPVGSVVSSGNHVAGGTTNDKRTLYLMNTDSFDRIAITNNTGFGGFSIDDLTLEAAAVPEPATIGLLIPGIGLLGARAATRRIMAK